MSSKVFAAFKSILKDIHKDRKPNAVLEISAYRWTLLSLQIFVQSRRVALNLDFNVISSELAECEMIIGNSNHLAFRDNEFDCILTCSTFEHDKYFWRSIGEIKQVLAVGGLFIVGVPIFMTLPTDVKNTTLTYARHGFSYNADFYRFSEQAVREVFMDAMDIQQFLLVRRYPNPYAVVAGFKR